MTNASRSAFGVVLPLLALIVGLFAPASQAQTNTGVVPIRVVADRPKVAPGEELIIAVVMDHPEGYHSWPNQSVKLPDDVAKEVAALRTEIGIAKDFPAGFTLAGTQWPEPVVGSVPDPTGNSESGNVSVPLYSGTAVTYLVINVAKDANPGTVTLPVSVHYQSCNEKTCFRTETLTLPVTVTVAAAPDPARNESVLFEGFNRSKATGASAPPAPKPPAAQPTATAPAVEASHSLLGIELGGSTVVLFLAAILGGAVLNLTPCVLPIIPIKIMTLVEHAGSPQRRITLGLWMATGVVVFWVAMGLPMVLLKSQIDPTRLIFGHWKVTLGLGLLIGLMGLGIMGLFAINLPQAVYSVSPKADSARGSFFYGIMTGVLGLPCFGFVAGGLLAGSSALPSATIMLIFAGLGIGMAAPYLILTIKPGLVKKIPRTGPASDLVKQVMGLFLIAGAAFFIAAGMQTLTIERPYISNSLQWWAIAFIVTIAALWLLLRTFQIAKSGVTKLVILVLSAGLMFATIGFAWVSTQADKEDYLRRMAGESAWKTFTPEELETGQAAGKVVVVDFTASWCIICKSLRRGVLDRDPVVAELRKPDVVALEADLSSDTDPGWKVLKGLDQTGVPTLAIYGPAIDKPIVLNAYTKATVMDAIRQARGK